MLPDPTLTLTIPSLHDGTVLDCRIYHPASLAARPHTPPWQRHTAVFAHPYATMGGCYDDPIVDFIGDQLLRKGYLLGTFNFRGAGRSAGRTSWTARPERDDYISFLGFMVYYTHHLNPFGPHTHASLNPHTALSTNQALPEDSSQHQPVLMMGGYSYGAMITSRLPPLVDILEPFTSPASGSAASQIRLRATSLAEQQNVVLSSARTLLGHHRNTSGSKHGIRIGGDEGGGRSPRRSHEGSERRSFSDAEEKLRRGVNEVLAKTKVGRLINKLPDKAVIQSEKHIDPPADGKLPPLEYLIIPKPAYLLVSPLHGIATHLTTMSLIPSALLRFKAKTPEEEAAEAKLVQNHTLAVYGDKDAFMSVGTLRSWTERLTTQEGSQFQGHEIKSAGHFWFEEGVLYSLVDSVNEFASKLLETG
ncbi:hypothetical protein PT974_06451 [Cladobotryum mycophilum]|uniref:Uncharacterized protein n=1 Tax=Cladobotryum mycophilum TaxID=491253 RepID=A0ABR0SLI1_9HYPO